MNSVVRLLFIFATMLVLNACGVVNDALIDNNNGPRKEDPTVEELAKELETTPKSDNGRVVEDKNISQKTKLNCLGTEGLGANLSNLGYQVVIAVDKSQGGQYLTVYDRGQRTYQWAVSTGAETPKQTKTGEISQRRTPLGFFSPIPGRLYENYFSKTWKADMPYAIFFNGGVAIHAAHESRIDMLGMRDSGGCVRLEPGNAEALFNLVKHEVGMGQVAQIDRNGCVAKKKNGDVIYKKGYRTLIVVHD